MIDEYRYHSQRARFWRAFFSRSHVVVVTASGLALLALQAVTIYLTVSRR